MLGRAMIGSVVLCALGSGMLATGPETHNGMTKPIWGPRRERVELPTYPPAPVWHPTVQEFIIRCGPRYTAVVIVPQRTAGSQRLQLTDGRSDVPIVVQGGASFVLPFEAGWSVIGRACIRGDLCDGEFEAWGIAENGLVKFDCVKR